MDTSDLVEEFLATISSSHTQRSYQTDLHRFFGDQRPQQSEVESITPKTVQTFVRSMYRKGLAESTQRRRLSALRRFFDWLVTQGVRAHNPARHPNLRPKPPDEEPSGATVLTREEVEQFLTAAASSGKSAPRDQALTMTIVYAALRRKEIAGLTVGDVRPLGRHWILDLSGRNSSAGYVRVPEVVVDTIERMKNAYGIESGPLWRSLSNQNRGAPMSPDAIYKAIRRVASRAGVGAVSIDSLRQTGLQLALDGGADLAQIQAHGRFNTVAGAAESQDYSERPGTLEESAAENIELDLSGLSLSD